MYPTKFERPRVNTYTAAFTEKLFEKQRDCSKMQRTPRFWSSKLLGERWWYRAWNGGRAGLDHGGGAGLYQDEEGGWAWSALDWGGICGEPPIPAPAPRPS